MNEDVLNTFPDAYAARVRSRLADIDYFCGIGMLSPEMFVGKDVLDWEAGDAALSIAFMVRGASRVFAIDSWATVDAVPPQARAIEGFSFMQAPLERWAALSMRHITHFDLIFSNTVTEHIRDLPTVFDAIRGLLKPGGLYFNNHDNYYSPCGSHDHGFWFYGANNTIEFQGVECWSQREKCAASAEHRTMLATRIPWTWAPSNNAALTPEDCSSCRYYKRAKPWAHLQAVSEFTDVFNDASFLTQRPTSSLNKVTPFQLHQLFDEAGFEVIKSQRAFSNNEPPEALYDLGFSKRDLTTTMVRTLCRARP